MLALLRRLTHSVQTARTPQELRTRANEAAERMKVENREWWVLLSFQDVRLHV